MSFTKEAIIEAVKEGARIALFAAVSAVALWLGSKVNALDPTSLQFTIGTIFLRLVDKFIHENKDIEAKGIAPF